MLVRVLLLAGAGACGTLARYGLGGLVHRLVNTTWPLGTWVVNVAGSFLFGAIWALADERGLIGVEARIVLLAGFMGAFTTFSTFSFETVQLLRDGQWAMASCNAAAQVLVGLAAVFIGMAAGRLV